MYLTEKRLGVLLAELYPDNTFIHDKSVPNSKNKRYRPDYRCDELMLIVEFDGASHYQSAKRIIKDKEKDADYEALGYEVVRIPYFIQPSSRTLVSLFGIEVEYTQGYPQGFIDKKAILPADYCCLGITRFEDDVRRFEYLANEIVNSLQIKIQELGDVDMVLPKRLEGIRYL